MADAVITFTESRQNELGQMKYAHIVCDWLAATAGTGTATTTYAYTGWLKQVLFVPDSGGTAPDNLHDITITDGTNDLLFGQGADLSGTLSIAILSNLGFVAQKTLTMAVSGAGDANGGTIYIDIEGV